jgi:hypothetical protein
MAVVILGGLVTSTALNLFFLPAVYLRYGRSRGTIAETTVLLCAVDRHHFTRPRPRGQYCAQRWALANDSMDELDATLSNG